MAVQDVSQGLHEIDRPTNQIAIVLIVITAVEFIVGFAVGPELHDQVAFKQFIYIVLVVLAIAKAFFVVTYFMGLKYEEHKNALAVFVIIIPVLFVFYFILMPIIGIPSFSGS